MNREDAETLLFGEALACEELRPASFVPGAIDSAAAQADGVHAETFLQAIAVVEDGRIDDPDEHSPSSLALNRIESKLDLLTMLVGAMLQGTDRDPLRVLLWSARGARLSNAGPLPPGTPGCLRIQPSDWLPQTLRLPAVVLANAGDADETQLWLRFENLSPGLETALERHLFRVHRREIAERRRPR